MKRRQLALILAVCMGASLLGGCGNSAASAEAEKVIMEASENEPEETISKTESNELYVVAGNEDGTFLAYDKDGKEYTLILTDSLSEDEKAAWSVGSTHTLTTGKADPDNVVEPEELEEPVEVNISRDLQVKIVRVPEN